MTDNTASISFYLHKLRQDIGTLSKPYARDFPAYWQGRLWAQADFLNGVSRLEGGRFDETLRKALAEAYAEYAAKGYISDECCLAFERTLAPAAAACREYTVHCIGHAHIDMNWMWPFDETVMVALDTFRTMLRLMREYPEFTFGQSQASCYRIVEKYGEPWMLDEIRQRVREGRWEVTASTWVEADKNMPSLESMARHALYTKSYLSDLLDLPQEKLDLDFEPDTFGQSLNIPEIMRNAGVRYYYHNRGKLEPFFTRWEAPSGASVLVYRDTSWYNAKVDALLLENALQACEVSGQKNMLKIYGVGDHGGGPTRRDISALKDMASWPIYPTLRFSTYHAFFEAVDREETRIPVSRGERNPIFTGCYTTQTFIKQANRRCERVLGGGELFSAADHLATGRPYPAADFAEAWENVLFSQFHDILPGSGVRQTREYAMGKAQETLAIANTERTRAMRHIAASLDTSAFIVAEDLSSDSAMGAGAGYGVDTGVGQAGAAGGKRRVFTIFNPLPFERTGTAELVIWDWDERDADLISFTALDGSPVEHQVLDGGFHDYWTHSYVRTAVRVTVPAGGYTSVILSENADAPGYGFAEPSPRQHFPDSAILENDLIRVTFDVVTGAIVSYLDKETGEELCGGSGGLRLIQEDTDKGMTSWVVGRYKSIRPLTENVRVSRPVSGGIRSSLRIEAPISDVSSAVVTASIDKGSKALTLSVETDWHELPVRDVRMPQLNFAFALRSPTESFKYDVPGGVIERAGCAMDMPGLSFIGSVPGNGEGVMLFTDSKYGYRGDAGALSVTLVRSSYDPDPLPEAGRMSTRICLAPVPSGADDRALLDLAAALDHPFEYVCDEPHPGPLCAEGSFFSRVCGSVAVSGVKLSEDGAGIILRAAEVNGQRRECAFTFAHPVSGVEAVDFTEKPLTAAEAPTSDGCTVRFTPEPNTVFALKITF